MAVDSQVEPDSVDQRDRQWLANVYRGDKEPDLTVRAVLAGMIFGGIMSVSNLYVGLKMGWGLGVDIAAVIVIFAVFKVLRGIGLVRRPFGIMENTMMMTVAVAASWISSAGLVSAVPALTMLTGYKFVPWQLTLFIAVILYLGLFMAIPLKRQMIQVDSLRFPGNIPTGETLKVMYAHGGGAMKKAGALGISALAGMFVGALRGRVAWLPDQFNPSRLFLQRIPLGKLTLSFEPNLIFLSIGGLFGIKVGLSMLLGVIINYGILAPRLIQDKVIHHLPPKVTAVALPQLPLVLSAGQTFAVRLDEAVKRSDEALGRPLLPSAEELEADPGLSSMIATQVVRYTWTRRTTYRKLSEVVRDLGAAQLPDGSPNPLYGVVAVSAATDPDLQAHVLCLEAPKAIDWQARLSVPADQPGDILTALGLELGPHAKPADVQRVDEQKEEREKKAMPSIGGFRNICAWSLWPGATVLVVGGLLALAFQWRTLGRTFASIFAIFGRRRQAAKGPLDHLEIPMTWFVFGVLFIGAIAVLMLAWVFSIPWWMGALAVVLTFFLSAVAARAGAETSINPIGALGKVTQLTFGAMNPRSVATNLMTAGVTAGAACSCCDTVGNLKVGHMVGANPRRQFISQLFGVLAGAVMAVPAYFLLVPDVNILGGEKFAAPSALVWKGVAEMISKGLGNLPPSALWAMGIAFVVGVVIVVVDNVFPQVKPYTPSATALGIALTTPAYQGLAMFLGAAIVWVLERKAAKWNEMYTIPIASGCIAGESIMGVILALLVTLGLMRG
jgi:uncharacterized oligopeptide transporter (OPT) family protein